MIKRFKEFMKALEYASAKHKNQRRKGAHGIPYINHPIEVANLLATCLDENSPEIFIAAILHDTIEDTDATPVEIEHEFGKTIKDLVLEVTDDMRLSKAERWRLQIEKAPGLSPEAKMIKIADKACNVKDMVYTRALWTRSRKIQYLEWAKQVIDGCHGINAKLDAVFEERYREGKKVLGC